jgi:hypothetical protein
LLVHGRRIVIRLRGFAGLLTGDVVYDCGVGVIGTGAFFGVLR